MHDADFAFLAVQMSRKRPGRADTRKYDRKALDKFLLSVNAYCKFDGGYVRVNS